MKIAFFIYSMAIGGAERVTATLANYWADQGRDVIVVTMTSISDMEYALAPAVRRIALGLASDNINRRSSLRSNWDRIAAMRKILTIERPEVAVGMMATSSILLSLAGIGTTSLLFGTERVHPPTAGLTALWSNLRRVSYGLLHSVVAQTQSSATWIEKNTFARRTCVIPNPVLLPLPTHPPTVAPASILGPTDTNRMILCAGRLVPQKRFDKALTAFAAIAQAHSRWHLVIVGEGPMRGALVELAKNLSIDHRVSLPGRVGNLSDWYKAADLFLLTSDFEGFPNTLLEAMAHGAASIAVDCESGPRDLIDHDVNGLLVPMTDNEALPKALKRCMGDDNLRRRLGRGALDVRERYDLDRIAGAWDQEFSRHMTR